MESATHSFTKRFTRDSELKGYVGDLLEDTSGNALVTVSQFPGFQCMTIVHGTASAVAQETKATNNVPETPEKVDRRKTPNHFAHTNREKKIEETVAIVRHFTTDGTLSIYDLAKLIGCHWSTVYQWASGNAVPHPTHQQSLAQLVTSFGKTASNN
ncbi:MAG: helix-turn-helix transcriptional regulator [Anaerolineales bacterium]|jgi:hypothetical protein|nr:helix-turn-helix transcriptional regulator [Anaerolineales bacterium]|tara:strand:- start:3007 stop:3474 length:468 start_codon:yes stop_codon:yes gene_type:complete